MFLQVYVLKRNILTPSQLACKRLMPPALALNLLDHI